jgi:hypothetical protein
MAKRLTLTNDTAGYVNPVQHFFYNVAGNITAVTAAPVFTAPVPGTIVSAYFSTLTYPTSTDRTVTVTPKKVHTTTTTSLCTTNPAFSFAASGTGSFNTVTAVTGITPAVVDTVNNHVVAGDQVTVDVAVAGSNGTLGTGLAVVIGFVPDAA